ncbi:hypothetical protein BH23GEM6_BH23GEM6_23430 [soil metagenome]
MRLKADRKISARPDLHPAPGRTPMTARDLAYAGLFGAAALLLPVIFHVLQLGHALMPMYIPLAALPFLVRGRVAITTALLVPLLSGAVTGMPPFFPPIAPIMAMEMAFMSGLIAAGIRMRPSLAPLAILFPTLIAGRLLNFALSYGAALLLDLPPWFAAGLSFIAGWPGVILMLIVVPPLVSVIGPAGMRSAR